MHGTLPFPDSFFPEFPAEDQRHHHDVLMLAMAREGSGAFAPWRRALAGAVSSVCWHILDGSDEAGGQ
jgi:hypothetical protein